MLAISLTDSQQRAVRRLVEIFERASATYQFTGGFAGNLHGSRWPLHDIDVDVAARDLPRVARRLELWTTHPLARYEDEEFRLHLLRGRIEGVDVDVSQAEDAWICAGGTWVPLPIDLGRRQRVRLFELDLDVWVQPIDELIAYKELLGRAADVTDLRSLPRSRA